MRFAVEAWAPEYGSAMGTDEQLAVSQSEVEIDVEVPGERWRPMRPHAGATPADRVIFTDGVRRVDAQVWVEGSDGTSRPGLCASYAAGAVRCDGRAELAAVEVRRGLFTAAPGAEAIQTRHGPFPVRAVGADDADQLTLCLQQRMGELEVEVALLAGDADLVCVDGPLRAGGHRPGTIGYVKTHHVRYLPPAQDAVVARLAAGERTPLFVASGRMWSRYLWYLRLPGSDGGHPWAGIVRCETSADADTTAAVALADRVTLTLPPFASRPHKDSRAPQNLYPIAGLERALRHRLGDATLLYRALRAAAVRPHDGAITGRAVTGGAVTGGAVTGGAMTG